jgi:hypothetical protein
LQRWKFLQLYYGDYEAGAGDKYQQRPQFANEAD